MSGPGAVPPPIPPEILAEERDRIRQQLELEKGKSRVLYERAYQDYLMGITGQRGKAKPAHAAASETEFMATVKRAYADAYSLRAFRDVMEDVTGHGTQPAPETMPSSDNLTTALMKSGVPPEVVNKWLKTLDPEALGALIALGSQNQNPALAQLSYAMSQRGQKEGLTIKDVIELNSALAKTQGAPNISIDLPKLIDSVKAQPPSASPTEIANATITAIRTGMELASAGRSSEEPKQKGGVLETLLTTPEGIRTAREVGLIGGDSSMLTIVSEMRKNDQEFQKSMRESDRRFELRLEQMHAETALRRGQLHESRRRTDLIAGALQRVGKAVADGFSEGGGEEKAADGRIPDSSGLKQYKCECGAPIIVPPDAKVGGTVQCAKCGAVYEIHNTEGTAQ